MSCVVRQLFSLTNRQVQVFYRKKGSVKLSTHHLSSSPVSPAQRHTKVCRSPQQPSKPTKKIPLLQTLHRDTQTTYPTSLVLKPLAPVRSYTARLEKLLLINDLSSCRDKTSLPISQVSHYAEIPKLERFLRRRTVPRYSVELLGDVLCLLICHCGK